MSAFLQRLACPSCGSPIELQRRPAADAGAPLQCAACGSTFLLRGHVCPYCGMYHEQAAGYCRRCGAGLSRRCPRCQTVNWIGDEYCMQCGVALDMLETISQRYSTETSDRLYRQMEEVGPLKQDAQVAAETRLNRMLEEEREFQAALQMRRQAQKQKELQAVTLGLIAAGVILLLMIIVVLSHSR